MVTKQQQLELIAKECHAWKGSDFILVSDTELGFRIPVTAGWHLITRQEWQQERDKMQKKGEKADSWHERGEFPPAGCECEAEYDTNRKEWHKVRIIGVDDGECFFRWLSGASNGYVTGYKRDIDFRPLRTEREKAIDEMALLAIGCEKYAITQNAAKAVCELLYDAGCRMEKSK